MKDKSDLNGKDFRLLGFTELKVDLAPHRATPERAVVDSEASAQ